MALNDDGMLDVRRWYFDERELASDLSDSAHPIGYEAALPALQLSTFGFEPASDPARESTP